MNDDFSCLYLVYKSGDVFIVFTLGLREARIFSDAFEAVLAINFYCDAGNCRDLLRVRLPSGEGDHITRIKSRVSDGGGIKRHVADDGDIVQNICQQHFPCL